MDSSPGLAAVSVRPEPGGVVGPLAGPQLRSLRVVDRRAAAQPKPSRRTRKGARYAF